MMNNIILDLKKIELVHIRKAMCLVEHKQVDLKEQASTFSTGA